MKYLPAAVALTLLVALSFQSPSIAQNSKLPDIAKFIVRQPAVSPDGSTIAFVFDGDIWSMPLQGGIARRLTITEDNDGDPCFSPDGKWLAFRSRRYGNDDVFVMPAEGGVAKRLTYADSWDSPDCWLPDSSGVIFNSYRKENSRDLYVVRLEGGEPWPITGGGLGLHEYDATISPNGKHIAYVNRGGDPARRRSYHGHADGDIWLCDFDGVKTSNHRRLTENESHDASPVFANDKLIHFVTFEGKDGRSAQVGDFGRVTVDGERLPTLSRQPMDPKELAYGGGYIVFSTGAYSGWNLYQWQTMNRAPFHVNKIDANLASDVRRGEVRETTLTNATEYAVSPDGKKLAFIAGHDVYVMPAKEDGVPVQITDTVNEEKGLTWGHESENLIWVHGVTGQPTVYNLPLHFAGEPQKPEIQLYLNAAWPKVDNSGRVFAMIEEKQIDVVRQIGNESKESVPIEANLHGYAIGSAAWARFDVSPNGEWVLYEQPNANYDDHVMLANTETGEKHAISHLFGSVSQPRFSADGKRVVFINNQEGDYDVWTIDLDPELQEFKEDEIADLFKKKEEPAKEEPKDETEEDSEPEEEEKKEERKEEKKPKKTKIKVVLDGIKDRVKRITTMDGHELSPVALSDDKTFCFIGNSQGQANIWRLVLDPHKGPDLDQLTTSRTSKDLLTLSADEKTLWWLDSGDICSMPVKGGKVTKYAFRVQQRRDRTELRHAAFQEAVHVMKNYYYDPEHHGIDWDKTAARYEKALGSVGTGDEYDVIMDELLGELNSSHQGYTGADSRTDGVSETTGWLGLMFDAAELSKGRYRITEIIKNGPCDLPEGKPEVGTYLNGINGEPLGGQNTLAKLLVSTVGKKTVLQLNSGGNQPAVMLPIKPITRGALYELYYRRWVEMQRDMVTELSDGRLGYVHIRGMNDPALREFKHELGDEMLDKDGVVIDVRYNGGGYTAVHILEILIKRPWLKRQRFGLDDVSENIYRSVALEKPSILLINQASFSNAEIFAEGFRKLEIGKIVGVDTAGGVIGTSSYNLIDGSRMRLPSTGAYTVEGENLELAGRKPDVFVENNPDELDKGIDRQTQRAVKELLAQLDE